MDFGLLKPSVWLHLKRQAERPKTAEAEATDQVRHKLEALPVLLSDVASFA